MSKLPLRSFRLHFQCEECPNEFTDVMPVIASSYCPCCDREIEPYASEALFDETETDEEVA